MKMESGTIARKVFGAAILLVVSGVIAAATMSPADESNIGSEGGAAMSDPWSLAPVVDVAAVKTESIDFGVDGMPVALQSGTVLMAVDVEPSENGAIIHFHSDGELALARTFVLNAPSRLVVDLPGIRGDLLSDHMVLGGDVVVGVRVGVHPDKLRVVIDGGQKSDAFKAYQAVPAEDGLYLMIGEGSGLQRKLDARVFGEETFGSIAEPKQEIEEASEPVLLAMRGDDAGAVLANPWDEMVESPDDAEILARVAESYSGTESVVSASGTIPSSVEMPGAVAQSEPEVLARLAEPFAPSVAAEDRVEASKTAEASKQKAGGESASNVWALEITAEPVVEVVPAAVEEEVAVEAPVAEPVVVPTAVAVEAPVEAPVVAGDAASQAAAAAFLARAGKPVETRISDLSAEEETKPGPVLQAQATTAGDGYGRSAQADPWALKPTPAPAEPPPAPSMPAPMPMPMPAPGYAPAEIFGLQYDRDEVRDRIAILGDKPASYRLFEPAADTLMIILDNAVLSEGMGERITPEFGGPVSQVTIFQQPDIEADEVRIVIRRAAGLQPDVYQRGSLILADFPSAGVAASLPVVLIPESSPEEAPEQVEQSFESSSSARAMDEDPPSSFEIEPELIDGSGDVYVGDFGPGEAMSDPAAGYGFESDQFQGSPISLDFKDVPITDVLRLIAEVSDLNIIAGDEVQGTITLRLVEVPWDQALDIILVTRGLGFVQVGNVLRIAPAEVLQAEEAERLQERRNKEQLEDLEVKLQPLNYASVGDVKDLVRRLLSPRGTVNTDVRTNTVIIKDIPSVIAEATALIEALDTQTPQVMIEAKIVEAALDFGRELGSTWSVGTNEDSGPISTGGVTWDGKNNVAISNPIASEATGIAQMGFLVLDDNVRIGLKVEAMEEAGEGKVISSPRVVTLDNREAVIEQGVSIPFQTFEGGDAKLEFVDAVLSLKVTPHITPDESIIMALEVSRNAPDSTVATPTGSPAIAKNQAKTETLVKNGQTLVIGGIYTIDKSTTETRVPYLHQIPVIGAAFKSRRVSDSRKELLIFVTPRIVVNPALADN
jgi:type IV pilus secretin PilQ/predicted competence protein